MRQALGAHDKGASATRELCRDREFSVVIDLDNDEKKKRSLGFGASQLGIRT